MSDSAITPPGDNEGAIARQLVATLDRALELGLWEHADRVAATASRLADGHAALCDRIARLRLAQGDPDTALRMIESCASPTASLRLLRIACLLQVGRKIEAHLELLEWSTQPTAPLQARLMHALLEFASGDESSAVQALLRNLRQIKDPRTLMILALLGVVQNRREWAEQWAGRVRRAVNGMPAVPDVAVVFGSVGLFAPRGEAEMTPQQIATLACELRACEDVIEPLVEAACLSGDHRAGGDLSAAIHRCRIEDANQTAFEDALSSLRCLVEHGEAADPVSWIELKPGKENTIGAIEHADAMPAQEQLQ